MGATFALLARPPYDVASRISFPTRSRPDLNLASEVRPETHLAQVVPSRCWIVRFASAAFRPDRAVTCQAEVGVVRRPLEVTLRRSEQDSLQVPRSAALTSIVVPASLSPVKEFLVTLRRYHQSCGEISPSFVPPIPSSMGNRSWFQEAGSFNARTEPSAKAK